MTFFHTLHRRISKGCSTAAFPAQAPALPPKLRGHPRLSQTPCPDDCHTCADACPTHAIRIQDGAPLFDLGHCIFCGQCAGVCPNQSLSFANTHELSTLNRDDLLHNPRMERLAAAMTEESWKLFDRSLQLRQVSAGGCNACELDANVLNTPVFDLARFGIQFVASPRHADGLLITGPVTQNMREALLKTYEATPAPKMVIACGTCAISGGIYRDMPETCNGVESLFPIDLFVPGCPPHPYTLLHGLLLLLNRLGSSAS